MSIRKRRDNHLRNRGALMLRWTPILAISVLAIGFSQSAANAQQIRAGAQAQQFRFNPYAVFQQAQAAQNAFNVQSAFNTQANTVYSTGYYGSPVNPVTFPQFFN